jgi:hypothetical protein
MKAIIIAGILFIIALAIFVHQYLVYDILWEIEDLSHECWIIMFAFGGIVLLAFKRG